MDAKITWNKLFLEGKSRVLYFLKTDFSRKSYASMFVVAVILGVGIKSLLNDVVTIGYDDYTSKGREGALNLNVIQEELIQKGESMALSENQTPRGEICTP